MQRHANYIFACSALLLTGLAGGAKAQVQDFDVDGVHVILEQTDANQIVAVIAGFEGGYGYSEIDNPALAGITADVTTSSGTEITPKAEFRTELAKLVTTIGANASPYRTEYTLSCVKPKFTQSWKIFADVLKHPLYDKDELGRVREDDIASINGRPSDPEGYSMFMLDSVWSKGTHIGRITEPQDVGNVTIDAMRNWHTKMLERSRLTITVVGNIQRDELTTLIHRDLADIPKGTFSRHAFERVMGPNETDLIVEDRVVPTSYIFGRYVAPPRTDKDYYPLLIGAQVLDDRLYEEVRTKRNLSYAPHSVMGGGEGKYVGQISVSTTMPDSTMHVITRELEKIRTEGITAKELKDRRAEFITEFYMSQQTNLGLASRLYNTYRERGDWRPALTVISDVNAVTLDQVKEAFQKYLHNILWSAVGTKSAMTSSSFHFE